MITNKVLNINGAHWLVRQAVDEAMATACIDLAGVRGTSSSVYTVNDKIMADVQRLHDNGRERLPYGEQGEDYSHLIAPAPAPAASGATFPCDWKQLRQVAAEYMRAIPHADAEALESGLDGFNLHYLGFEAANEIETHQSVILFGLVNKRYLTATFELLL